MRRFAAVDSLHHVPPPPSLSGLSGPELEALLLELFAEVAALKQVVAEQREEIARLKGLKGRPTIKPSGMDKGTEPAKPAIKAKRRGRGKVTPRVDIEEKVIEAEVPLRSVGGSISKRQLQRLLTEKHDGFIAEAQDVPRAGLETSRWVSVDDTGARHAGKNGFCTRIGNDWFTWFGTRSSKSRLNFLDLPRAGRTDNVRNDAAYDDMRNNGLPAATIARLMAEPETRFSDQAAWLAHLDWPGLAGLKVTPEPADRFAGHRFASRPEPVRVASEGAVWGSVQSHQLLGDAVVLSDDAGQFNVGRHALCWVHAERLVHKLDTFTDKHRAAQKRVRGLIWNVYASLKVYQAKPGKHRSLALRTRFDRSFLRRTGFATLDRLHANKAELLMVLDRPEIPLHTNGSENDIRGHVTRRKVSAGTRGEVGRDCRDTFLGLAKTCAKLGIPVWDYLGSRLKVAGHAIIKPLGHYVRQRIRYA